MTEENVEYGTGQIQFTKPDRNRIWVWVTVGILALVLIVSLAINFVLSYALLSSGFTGITTVTTETKETFHETWIEGEGNDKVVQLPVRGIILADERGGSWFSESEGIASQIIAKLKQAQEDESVKAVFLDIDSPGGEITASDMIHNQILKFKESGKKVIVLMDDLAASGAYYISAPADKIIAHPTTITGSIGVIMQTINLEGLFEKIGLKDVTIKSGPKKDILSPTRTLTEEERILLEDIIQEMHGRFKNVVAEGRGMPIEKVTELADGRIYTGEQALANGLVDKIGYRDDAIEIIKETLGVNQVRIVEYDKVHSFMDFLRGYMAHQPPPVISIETMRKLESPRLMYLWRID